MNADIDIRNLRIETERLILRSWENYDLYDLFDLAKVPGVGERAGWKHHKTAEESEDFLDIFMESGRNLAIEFKEERKVVGTIELGAYDEFDLLKESNLEGKKTYDYKNKLGAEIGFVVNKNYWKRGLATEALKALVSFSFDNLNLDFLIAGFFLGNRESKRVLEKCGFTYLKDYKVSTQYGTREASRLYIIHREDFE